MKENMPFLGNNIWLLNLILELPRNEYFIRFLYYRLILTVFYERNSGITTGFVFEGIKNDLILHPRVLCFTYIIYRYWREELILALTVFLLLKDLWRIKKSHIKLLNKVKQGKHFTWFLVTYTKINKSKIS